MVQGGEGREYQAVKADGCGLPGRPSRHARGGSLQRVIGDLSDYYVGMDEIAGNGAALES